LLELGLELYVLQSHLRVWFKQNGHLSSSQSVATPSFELVDGSGGDAAGNALLFFSGADGADEVEAMEGRGDGSAAGCDEGSGSGRKVEPTEEL
jgi:hypothetical protein